MSTVNKFLIDVTHIVSYSLIQNFCWYVSRLVTLWLCV